MVEKSGIISRCFTSEHWEKPFEVNSQLTGALILYSGETRQISVHFNRKEKAFVIGMTIFAGFASVGVLVIPVFILASSIVKSSKEAKIEKFIQDKKSNASSNPNSSTKLENPANSSSPLNTNPKNPIEVPKQLPPPPQNGITAGLPNVGNTCWLNSVLKAVFACSTLLDFIFEVDVEALPNSAFNIPKNLSDIEKMQLIKKQKAAILDLQMALKRVVYQLRTQQGGTIDRDLCQQLVNALPILMPDQDIRALDQQEAAEAILLIESRFGWPTNDELDHTKATEKTKEQFVQALKIYSSNKAGTVKFASEQNYCTTISLTLQKEDLKNISPIDFSTYFRDECTDNLQLEEDLKLDDILSNTASEDNADTQYTMKQMFINVPPKGFSVNVSRNVLSGTPKDIMQAYAENKEPQKQKCTRKLKISEKGEVFLIEHDRQFVGLKDDDKTVEILPKYKCRYAVSSAIIHGGGSSGGHYTAIEITPDKLCRDHNDRSTNTISIEKAVEACQTASFLTLRLVEKVPLTPTEISLLRAPDLDSIKLF